MGEFRPTHQEEDAYVEDILSAFAFRDHDEKFRTLVLANLAPKKWGTARRLSYAYDAVVKTRRVSWWRRLFRRG